MNFEFLKYGYEDGHVEGIKFDKDNIYIDFRKWDNKKLTLKIIDCFRFVSNSPIDREIGEVTAIDNSEEVKCVRSKNDETNLIQMNFYDAWDDTEIVISIIAKNIEVIEEVI